MPDIWQEHETTATQQSTSAAKQIMAQFARQWPTAPAAARRVGVVAHTRLNNVKDCHCCARPCRLRRVLSARRACSPRAGSTGVQAAPAAGAQASTTHEKRVRRGRAQLLTPTRSSTAVNSSSTAAVRSGSGAARSSHAAAAYARATAQPYVLWGGDSSVAYP